MPADERPYPPIMPFWSGVIKNGFSLLMHTLTRFHVTGADLMPKEGALIMVLNHLSYIDTPASFITFKRPVHPLAADKYKSHPIFRFMLPTSGVIYIDRDEMDRAALRLALNVLEDGEVLGVAIEGTRSKTGQLQQGKTGVAYFATRTNATILPAVMWGTELALPALMKLRRADVYIRYGAPFRLPEGRARVADLERYTEDIMLRMARMLPESYRGVYRDHPALIGAPPDGEPSPSV